MSNLKPKGMNNELFEGLYVPTNNQMGFMLSKIDPFIRKFVDYAIFHKKKWHLDVGTAYGLSVLEVLKNGGKIIANDIDQFHLDTIAENSTAYQENLRLSCVDIRQAHFEKHSLSSILFSRVLHFFSLEEIIQTLKNASYWLAKGGYIYIVNETPYFGTLSSYLPLYQIKKERGDIRASYLTLDEAKSYFCPTKRDFVTSPIFLFDEDVLEYIETHTPLCLKQKGYLNREGYFPRDALYDGRESLWAIFGI